MCCCINQTLANAKWNQGKNIIFLFIIFQLINEKSHSLIFFLVKKGSDLNTYNLYLISNVLEDIKSLSFL